MERILDRCIDASVMIAGALMALQFFSISIDVLLRYFFEISLDWVIYANEWSLFLIAFLGAAWLQRDGGQVRMDLLLASMGGCLRTGVEIFSDVLAIAVSAVLAWLGGVRTLELLDSGAYDFFKVDYIPLYFIYLVVPVGCLLLCLQSVLDLVKRARSMAVRDRPV